MSFYEHTYAAMIGTEGINIHKACHFFRLYVSERNKM